MNKVLYTLIFLLYSHLVLAQDATTPDLMTDVLGKKGVLVVIGILFFIFSYRNSVKLFSWIEDQTIGTRDYVLEKCELLFIQIEPVKVTYILLGLTFGPSTLILGSLVLVGKYTMGILLGITFAVIGWKTPRPLMNYLVARRVKKYETQMVDALNLLSNGLRAGLSVPQSIGMVVEELPAPVSQEFNYVLQQTKIGAPLDEAIESLVRRVPTEDNEMFVSSVSILRETGGNLAEVFDTIAEVIRERVRLKQKIDTYVAQGKMQGMLIGSMPFAMGAYFAATDPNFVDTMFGTAIGNVVLIAAIVLDFIGLFAMFKIIQIKA